MSVRFSKAFDDWLDRVSTSGECTNSTIKGYRTIGNTLKKFVGETTLIKDLDPKVVDDIFNIQMLKCIMRNGKVGYSNKSRQDFFHIFKAIINYSNVQGYLGSTEQFNRFESIKLCIQKNKKN